MTHQGQETQPPLGGALKLASAEVSVFTTQASGVARTAALAGVAIVWLYADREGPEDKLSVAITSLAGQWWLLAALGLFIGALALDVSQYVYASWRWKQFDEIAEVIATYDDFKPQWPSKSVQRAWSTRLGTDLAVHIVQSAQLFLPNSAYDSLPVQRKVVLARAREILDAVYSSDEAEINHHVQVKKIESLDQFQNLRTHINLPWAPERMATVIDRLFWSKMLCTVGGFVCLLVTIALAIVDYIQA